jgi:hypothetical protein
MIDYYELRVKGYIDGKWFHCPGEGLTYLHTDEGDTILSGPIRDQAALHGILAQIRDLALPLLAVNSFSLAEDGKVDSEQDIEQSCEER